MAIEEPTTDVEPTTGPSGDQDDQASPDLQAELDKVTAEREALTKQVQESQLATNKNLQDLQNLVADAFAAPAEPEPDPEKVDIDPMDPETYVRAMETVADKKVAASNKVVGGVMKTVLEDSFDTKKEALKARNPKVWEQVGSAFEEFYSANPGEKLRGPQSVEQVYKYYAGEWLFDNPDKAGELNREVPVTPTTPTTPGPTEAPDDQKAPELSPLEEHIAKQYGVTAEVYAKNRDDKKARKRESFKEERRLW